MGPTVGSLTALPATVSAGTTLTLSAGGIKDSSGTVTQVLFYRDANGNGVYDSGDVLVGSTTAISGGTATVAVSTSGLAAGSYCYFAKAVDNLDQSSTAASTLVTLLPANDYGNTAATAKAIAVPTAIAGTLGVAGDTNWFSFQAAAGKTYTITTTLGTLRDSVLYLYDSDGKKQLAMNDDYGSSPASRIVWTAPASGTYYVVVAGYGNCTGTYTLNVQTSNTAPVPAAIANQTMSRTQTTLKLTLGATDADGDTLHWSAQAMTADPIAQEAYNLDQQLGLHTYPNNNLCFNLRGASEKYLLGTNNSLYFLLPNGVLYRWGGSIAGSTAIATLGAAYYANPALLYQAPALTLVAMTGTKVAVSVAGNTLTINRVASYTADFYVRVTVSDGQHSVSETFRVSTAAASSAVSLSFAPAAALERRHRCGDALVRRAAIGRQPIIA